MNKRFFFSLSIVAVAFALILGSGTFNTAQAVPGESSERLSLPPGEVNLFGADYAVNSGWKTTRDADFRTPGFAPEPYGLLGASQQ